METLLTIIVLILAFSTAYYYDKNKKIKEKINLKEKGENDMFCKNCGKEIDENSIYCNYCGYILKFDKVSYEEKLKKINQLKNSITGLDNEKTKIQIEIEKLLNRKKQLEEEINIVNKKAIVASYNYSDYETLSSEQCKNELTILKNQEKTLIKENRAIISSNDLNSRTVSNNIKQLLRCFNCECDNIFLSLTYKNIDSLRDKIAKVYESLNTIFSTDNISIAEPLFRMKLEELNLIYSYEIIKQNEIELEKERRAQLLEEEKVRREIEKEKQRIQKEETQFKNEVTKLMTYLNKSSNDAEKQLYIDKIKELEDKLKTLESDKENVLNREQNTRAGFVYIISNIGSFGENIYKIGMTRRLEPMDRINELGDASVPFKFDVHAIIFSDDAPALENILHKTFEENRVNKLNPRKEFYNIDLNSIKEIVNRNYNSTVNFIDYPEANEYRESIKLLTSKI